MNKSAKKYKRIKKLGAYQSVSVVFSTALALFVIGLFGVLVLQAARLTSLIKQNLEVQVYLDQNLSENQRSRIASELRSSDYILKIEENEAVRFISKATAAEQFIEETGEDFSDFLKDNPLRDAFVINIQEAYQTNVQLDSISRQIEQMSGVYEVTYVKNLIDSINSNLTKVSLILLGLSVLMIIIVVLLINNAIKLALFSQRFLIRSMQLVGAKSSFIKGPFLKRAIFHGALSGIIASLLIVGVLLMANQQVDGLERIQQTELFVILYGILVATGALIAYFSTLRAMNKYLKMSLDELY